MIWSHPLFFKILIAAATDATGGGMWPTKIMDSWLSVIIALGGACAFYNGLKQYARAQRLQRTRFLVDELAKFHDDPKIAKAFAMIDDYTRKAITLVPDVDAKVQASQTVTVTAVITALQDRDEPGAPEENLYNAIRDHFDAFFDGLERFECLIQADAISEKEFGSFLEYWIRQFADVQASKKGAEFVQVARGYVHKYYSDTLESLCGRFGCGYPITEPASQ